MEEYSNLIQSFIAFYFTVYLFGYFFVFRTWSSKTRSEASSCLISIAHGTPAVLLAISGILSDPNIGFSSPNTKFQNLVLDYSTAYFLTDLLHLFTFYPTDVLFIAHHSATLFVFLTCRFLVHHGAVEILVLLILAESTSLCQNVWTLAGARKGDVEIAARVYDLLSAPFYGVYTIVRGFGGPLFLYKMAAVYWRGAGNGVIPIWVWGSWIVVVSIAISMSILWVSNLWVALFREKCVKIDKKFG